MSGGPDRLDRAGIADRIPHRGRMSLLDALQGWSAAGVHCSATSHADPANPLRSASGLLSVCAIEYAAQAMALHGALLAPPDGGPRAGYLVSVRDVNASVERLDDVAGALQVHAHRTAGDARQVAYRFSVEDESGRALVQGRATVVLNTPLAAPHRNRVA